MMKHVELEKKTMFMYHDREGKPVCVGHRLVSEGELVFQYEYTRYSVRKEVKE